jgi:hypothetical protein
MPFKDQDKRREFMRKWRANQRKHQAKKQAMAKECVGPDATG